MAAGNYEYQSDFAKKHRAEGKAEGRAFGEATAVVSVLEARGIPVTADQRSCVLGCSDLVVLERWIRKAVSVTTADELFVD